MQGSDTTAPTKAISRTNPPRNTGKWCKHHEDSGHNTNVCVALKTAVETLIQEGKLQQFRADLAQPQVANIQVVRGHINTIDGGAPINKLTNRDRKRHTRASQGQEVFNIHYDKPPKAAKVGWEPITFTEEEERGVHLPHDDPFLITAQVDQYTLSRVLIDNGSAVNVIFNQAYTQLGRKNGKLLQDNDPLLSFSGDITQPLGSDYMRLILGTNTKCAEIHTEFIVVDCLSSYNAILGRPALNKLRCIIAGHMLLLKFPTPAGTASIRGDQQIARKCYTTILTRGKSRSEILSVTNPPKPSDIPEDPRDNLSSLDSPDPEVSLTTIQLSEEHPERTLRIGAHLSSEMKEELTAFLRVNSEVFAWSYADMPGISTDIVSHKLSISPGSYPVKQKRRAYDEERY